MTPLHGLLAVAAVYGTLLLLHIVLSFVKFILNNRWRDACNFHARRANMLERELNRLWPLEAKYQRAFQRPRGARGRYLKKAPKAATDRCS